MSVLPFAALLGACLLLCAGTAAACGEALPGTTRTIEGKGYIVAFRQLSIPLGSVLAMVVFREPAPATRVAGIAVTTAGLLLIALG